METRINKLLNRKTLFSLFYLFAFGLVALTFFVKFPLLGDYVVTLGERKALPELSRLAELNMLFLFYLRIIALFTLMMDFLFAVLGPTNKYRDYFNHLEKKYYRAEFIKKDDGSKYRGWVSMVLVAVIIGWDLNILSIIHSLLWVVLMIFVHLSSRTSNTFILMKQALDLQVLKPPLFIEKLLNSDDSLRYYEYEFLVLADADQSEIEAMALEVGTIIHHEIDSEFMELLDKKLGLSNSLDSTNADSNLSKINEAARRNNATQFSKKLAQKLNLVH